MSSARWRFLRVPPLRVRPNLLLFMQLSQLAPASISFRLCRVRVFLALQPKTKPIHVTLLGGQAVPWLYENVVAIGDVDQLHRLL